MNNSLEEMTIDELQLALNIYGEIRERYMVSKMTVDFYDRKIKEVKLQLKNKESLEYAMQEKLGKGR